MAPTQTPTRTHETEPTDRDGRVLILRDLATVSGRFLLVLAAAGAIIWMLLQVKIVTVAAFLGFAQLALLWPAMTWLRRFMPRPLAVLLCILGFLGVVLGLLWFAFTRLGQAWPQIAEALGGGVARIAQLLRGSDVQVSDQMAQKVQQMAGDLASSLGGMAVSGLGAMGSFLTVMLMALFITIFGLLSGEQLWDSFRDALPRRWRHRAQASGDATLRTGRLWFGASCVSGTVEGLMTAIGLSLLGVPLAIPLGVLTFFAGFIPTIGAFLAGGVSVAVALFSNGLQAGLWTLALFLLIQQVEGNVLQPLFLSKAMQFHPIITLLMTTAGGIAFGFVGMLLTVPLAGLVYAAVSAWQRDDAAESVDDAGDGHE